MKILFITGRLAEPALRAVVESLARSSDFIPEILVLPISVAALMTPRWVARHMQPLEGISRVIVPGNCRGDLTPISTATGVSVERGPEDLRDLPHFFGKARTDLAEYGAFDIEILAEINHAPDYSLEDLLATARQLRNDGADVIDLGCSPHSRWKGVGSAVAALVQEGFRVSIDSFNPDEVSDAVSAGGELVLSVNGSNRHHAAAWGIEVVLIPDNPGTLDGLEESANFLRGSGIPFRIDPVLDPIGFGFANSLGRFLEVRKRFPDVSIMMGVGNISELTDVDSAGINTLLMGFCQEQRIGSVLTTQVINWARSSVKEIDLARRLMHYSVGHRCLPKHLEPRLVTLRDPKLDRFGPEALSEMAARIKDPNWRIFAEDGAITVMNGGQFLTGTDPFILFDTMKVDDPSHAFYLGFELMKAKTALTLHKNYRQDQALNWGYLTEPEVSHRDRARRQTDEDAS